MRITYDREIDALYICLKEATVTTKHLAEGIAADYDADGHLAGIEILDAVKRLGDPSVCSSRSSLRTSPSASDRPGSLA